MTKDLIDFLETLILLLLGLVFVSHLFLISKRWDKALVEETAKKPSIVHSYAYLDEKKEFTSAEILLDILENSELYIKVNGNMLDNTKVTKARNGNDACIEYIKNTLNGHNHTKTYEYTEDGQIVGLSFDR